MAFYGLKSFLYLFIDIQEPPDFQLCESPEVGIEQQEMLDLDGSPVTTPRAIVIDRSFHQSPGQQGMHG